MAEVQTKKAASPASPNGFYDEFTNLSLGSYARVDIVKAMIETLKEEFWGMFVELDLERRGTLVETLAQNQDLTALLLKNGGSLFSRALLVLPEKAEARLKDGFVSGAKELLSGDERRKLVALIFGSADFLDENELHDLAAKIKDEEIETIFSGLSAKQISVFAKALPLAKLLNLPNIVKRATVLAQVKSVICAETEADPKLKEICTTGKWAVIRVFGIKN